MGHPYHIECLKCHKLTTRQHSRDNNGLCKHCARVDKDGIPLIRIVRSNPDLKVNS